MFDIHYGFTKLEEAPPVMLSVFDSDEGFLDNDDFIGRATIDIPQHLLKNELMQKMMADKKLDRSTLNASRNSN